MYELDMLATLRGKGANRMTVFESLLFAVTFASLVVTILSFNYKK